MIRLLSMKLGEALLLLLGDLDDVLDLDLTDRDREDLLLPDDECKDSIMERKLVF